MVEEPTEARILVAVRLRLASIKRVETAAKALGISKSEVYRRAFAAGLPQVEAQARPARPAPKP